MNFEQLRSIGFNQFIAGQLHGLGADAQVMRVTEVQRGWFAIHDGVQEYRARALPQAAGLVVGDWIIVEQQAHDELWISTRLSPVNEITRRSHEGRRLSIASNIDTALLVMGLDDDFNIRRLERYLALTAACETSAVIVLTKLDIAGDAEKHLEELRQRIPPRYPALAMNALDTESVRQLQPWLGKGQTLCLLGSSGAGKSTLTNTLAAAGQKTGATRDGDGHGRHTTTFRSMHFWEQGACIIDAPGLRTLRPDGDEECLDAAFDDIAALASQCQFRDCKHETEPGCAVRNNVDPDRLFNYHKLLRDMQRTRQSALERIAERAKWKVLNKAAVERSRSKRE